MTDETEAVARAIMEAKGGCIVKDWQAERRDNPHVELAWSQAQAAIAALDKHRAELAAADAVLLDLPARRVEDWTQNFTRGDSDGDDGA